MGRLSDPGREARSRMAQAEAESRRRCSAQDGAAGGEGKPLPRRPQRYKLYDKIADRVSLNAINAVIIVAALLLVAVLIYGIATGSRG